MNDRTKDLRLNDEEVGKLYALCPKETYDLLRRLVKYGALPDPPLLDEPPSSNERVEKLLRDVAADAQLVGYNSPAQNALLKGANEIKRLKQELWVIATAIWENVSRDEVKHWAQGIRVLIAGASDEPPKFTVPPVETTASRPFYQLLDDYFNALVRGGRQTQIDEARLAIIRKYERVSGLSAVHGTPLHQALGSPLEPSAKPDPRGDTAIWVLAWLAHQGGLGHDKHRVIDAVMEGRATMRADGTLHIEPKLPEKAK